MLRVRKASMARLHLLDRVAYVDDDAEERQLSLGIVGKRLGAFAGDLDRISPFEIPFQGPSVTDVDALSVRTSFEDAGRSFVSRTRIRAHTSHGRSV